MSLQPNNNAICRVCTQKQPDATLIFSTETFLEQLLVISEVITTCASVQVYDNDGLPEHICSKCLDGLHQAYNFRRLCEKSDCELRNQFCRNKAIKTNEVWIDEPEFVNTGYEANVKSEESNSEFQAEGRLASEEADLDKHEIISEKIYVEEDKYGTKQDLNNVGIVAIKTEKCQEDSIEDKETASKISSAGPKKLHPELESASYKCDFCDKIYTSKYNLKKHTRIHTGENLYTCEDCGKQFTQSSHLRIHRKVHTGEKPFACEICGKSFSMNGTLTVHKRVHTGETPYKCDVCGKAFKEQTALGKHSRIHADTKPYECGVCKLKFSTTHNLKSHMKVHNRTEECGECGRKFFDAKALQKHMGIHTGAKQHECDVCGKQYTERYNLLKHKVLHTGEKRFKCDMCEESFFRKHSLVLHVRKHMGEKPYKCDECGKEFAMCGTLTNHKKTHFKEETLVT